MDGEYKQVTAVESVPPESNRMAEKVAKLEGDVAHMRSSTKSRLRELADLINHRFDGIEQEVRVALRTTGSSKAL